MCKNAMNFSWVESKNYTFWKITTKKNIVDKEKEKSEREKKKSAYRKEVFVCAHINLWLEISSFFVVLKKYIRI